MDEGEQSAATVYNRIEQRYPFHPMRMGNVLLLTCLPNSVWERLSERSHIQTARQKP